jgi:hypothetical protein
VADGQPTRPVHVGLKQRRAQARRRRAEHGVGRRGPVGPGQKLALEHLPLGRVLLHEVRPLDRVLDRPDDLESALGRERRERQAAPRTAGVLEHRRDLLGRPRVGVVHAYVHAVTQEARRPASADDPAAEEAHRPRPAGLPLSHRA